MRKAKTKPIEIGDRVTFNGREYTVVQLMVWGDAVIEDDNVRISVPKDKLKEITK